MNAERRMTPAGEVRIEERKDGGKILSGYAAVYFRADDPGTQYRLGDDYMERIAPGAFDVALKSDDDVICCFNHDPSLILGRRSSGTLRLAADSIGLRYEADLNPDDPEHVSIAAKVKRGDVKGSSFAFTPREGGQSFHKEKGVRYRTLESLKLYDASPVSVPAYQSTSAGLRAAGDAGEAVAALAAWEAERRAIAVRARLVELDD